MINWLSQRRKSIYAFLGLVATLLYVYNVNHPNIYVSAVLAALTVLGVHQATNSSL